MALGPLFPFQQIQFVQVSLLKPAPFCMLFAGLGSTIKPTISLFFSYYLILVLFSPPCPPPSFLLPQTFWQIWQELSSLPSCSIRLQWVPGHLYLTGNDALNELARRGALLAPSTIPCSLSLFLSLVFTLVFSRTGGVRSHLNSSTHRFPRSPSRNLCSLVTLAVFSLVHAATDTAFC